MKLRLIAALAGMAAIALTCAACVQQQNTLDGEDTPPPSPPGQSDELPQEHVHEPVFVEGIEPDCTAPGILAHWECGCGKYFADETCQTPLGEDELILSSDGHVYEPVTTEPTCTEQGYTKYVCSACGDSYIDGSSYTPPSEHDLFVEQVITEPDCTHGGERKLACRNCEYVEIEPLPATGHYYKETVVPPKCDADGYTLHICERCGDEYKDNVTQKLPHSYEVTEEVSPDCEHAGHRKFVCGACGDGYTVTLPELGHDYKETIVQPECDAEGYTIYSCTRCGDEYKDNFTQKLPHSYEPTVVPSTCTERGYTKYTCTACGHNYIDEQSYTPEKGHSYEVTEEVSPDCEHAGHRKFVCGACGDGYTVTLPELGHDYKETVVPPECDAEGYTIYRCTRCGDEYKDNFTQKLPHSYEPTVVPSTCTERGYTKYTCTACGHNYIDEQSYTPEKGHSYEVTEEVSPDCEHAGHRKFVCGACGDGYTVTLPETGHMWQVAEEGYTQEGAPYTVYVCSACGADRREEGDPPSATEGLIFAAAGDHCAVVGILSNDKAIELVIPSVHDGLLVTEIAESAFEDNLQIISASLPHGLQKIGRRAFAGCANLAEVNIPDTTTAISGSAFRDCRSLISVYYDAKSADDCQSLDIFRNAGRDSGGLTLYVGKGVERIPALLFSASGADTAPNLTDIVFEEGCALREIGEAAFTGCAYLKEIAMPASLEIIGAEAFLDCSELEYVSCPEGVRIGAAAFGNAADDFVLEYYAA